MKILRIDLNQRLFHIETLPEKYRGLGGRGLTAAIVAAEVSPQCAPLAGENKLVLAAGLCAGTSMPNSGRLSIGAKSPLTGTIKESNAGGSVAQKMARLGYRAIIVEGRADELTTLRIDAQGVTFLDAAAERGLGNYRLIETYRRRFGEKVGLVTIGQAGEMQLKASAIAVTTPDYYIRVAARGGLGSVMGSKNLKALVVDDQGGSPVSVADREQLTQASRAYSKGALSHPLLGGLRAFGTGILVNMMNEMGAIVTKNYSQGKFAGAESLSGERIAELTQKRPNGHAAHGCMNGCIIQCSNILTDADGEFLCSSVEYETLALLGSNCMIDDLDGVAKLNSMCNDFGLDTMDVGGAIAVAMEAGELPWGDTEAALALLGEVGSGTERGRMIGNGVRYTGEKLGVSRIPAVKGQCLSGYDPRALKGTGVTYATSTMGADHTCGNALPSPANPGYNTAAATGQAPVSQFLQKYFAAIDSLGLCLFVSIPALDMPELQQHLVDAAAAILGTPLAADYLLQLGGAVLETERKFNAAAGFTQADDRLPSFFREERLESGLCFDVSDEELDSVHPS
jgi:aldehyde:ferredoxin oxidoreductase